ncbi:MAG: HAMP domain-containing histidine kinase [Desulfobacter sp.]|nr:MAG: HAMP domain-containing histidine kinase [Desulfobacter sp.]
MKHRDIPPATGRDKGETLLARTADLLGRLGPDTVKNTDIILNGACALTQGHFSLYVETCPPVPLVRAGSNLPQGLARDIEHTPTLLCRPPETGTVVAMDDGPAPPDPLIEKYGISALLGAAVTTEMRASGILWVGAAAPLEFNTDHHHALRCLAGALGHQLQLARADTHRRVAQMAAQTAHDLNNILSGLVSYPELMLMQLEKNSPLKEPVSFIHESGVLASDLVQNFLFLARPQSYTPSPIDPVPVAEAYFSGSAHAALKAKHPHVRFSFRAQECPGVITISELLLTRLIAILVTHAAYGARPGSRVELGLDRRDADTVRLSIKDDGPPLSEKNIAHIFDPFYTRKKMGRPGSGLGLAVVRKIVKDHGGKITIESCAEKGNLTEIHFPVPSTPAGQGAP